MPQCPQFVEQCFEGFDQVDCLGDCPGYHCSVGCHGYFLIQPGPLNPGCLEIAEKQLKEGQLLVHWLG